MPYNLSLTVLKAVSKAKILRKKEGMSKPLCPTKISPVVGEVLLEMTPIGHQMKVIALDPVSLSEVSFIAPRNAVQADIKRLALSKLSYVIRKQQNLR